MKSLLKLDAKRTCCQRWISLHHHCEIITHEKAFSGSHKTFHYVFEQEYCLFKTVQGGTFQLHELCLMHPLISTRYFFRHARCFTIYVVSGTEVVFSRDQLQMDSMTIIVIGVLMVCYHRALEPPLLNSAIILHQVQT